MKRFYFLIFVVAHISISGLKAQELIDYLSIRDSVVTFSCGETSMEEVLGTLRRLSDIDTSLITNGLAAYFNDLGWAYQIRGVSARFTQDTLRQSITWFKRAAALDPAGTGGYYHNIIFTCFMLKDCEGARQAMKVYKKHVKKRKRDADLMKVFNMVCP